MSSALFKIPWPAYHKDSRWLVGQYGRLTSEPSGASEVIAPSLLDHRELAATVNYWSNPTFVFKLSLHHLDGNRFAGPAPEELAAAAAGVLKTKTDLVLFSAVRLLESSHDEATLLRPHPDRSAPVNPTVAAEPGTQ
jgi:hypothetical protein